MELIHKCSKSGLQVMLIRGLGTERDCAEREVLEAGVPLALSHRAVWAKHLFRLDPWFLLVRDASGRACAGIAIENVPTRAMPGHLILRLGKFGGSLPVEVCRVALEALTSIVKKGPRILWLQVNVLSRNGREEIARILENLGFREVIPPSSYRYTLVIDLKPSEDEILASLGKTARKRIRDTMKLSLRSVVITDLACAEKLKELQQEALRRTGGHTPSEDWRGILKMSLEHPNLSRVLGLFQGDEMTPDNMVAFGWVCNHGDHGEYRAAGSKRTETRIPFGFLLVWDMIRWAKETGAEWFDMGGVTLAEGDETALEGISEFKRHFSREVVEVGAEWVLEATPVRARIATAVSTGAQRMRDWAKKKA
jgi:lipid II:glycine glycyltransferase (peptidoglycan interpeptide bridge formation enzyme)